MALEIIKEPEVAEGGSHLGRTVNWGSIFCGAFVSLAMALLFSVLGNAIGLGLVNFTNPASTSGLLAGTWIYSFVTFVFSFYVGGAFTTSLSHLMRTRVGVAHAVVAWSLAIVASIYAGFLLSLGARIVLAGLGTNGVNWLLFCSMFFSLLAAAIGGATGVRRVAAMERLELEERRRHAA